MVCEGEREREREREKKRERENINIIKNTTKNGIHMYMHNRSN